MSNIGELQLEDGLTRLNVNGNGVLVFDPGDINLYTRLDAFARRLPDIQREYQQTMSQIDNQGDAAQQASTVLQMLREIDLRLKRELSDVFGHGNDFDQLLGGANLMTITGNGQRVITNFLNAIMPYIEKGTKRYMQDAAAEAVRKSQQRRAQLQSSAE